MSIFETTSKYISKYISERKCPWQRRDQLMKMIFLVALKGLRKLFEIEKQLDEVTKFIRSRFLRGLAGN